MAPDPKNDPVLQFFVSRLRSLAGDHLLGETLFGSRARGDARPYSDYDCLVLVKEITPWVEDAVAEAAGATFFEFSIPFSAFPVAEPRFKAGNYNPFFLNIRKEGVPLWP